MPRMIVATHGSPSQYNAGCRCPLCRESHRLRMTEQRYKRYARVAADDPAVPHGTATGYINWGCRCDLCKAAGVEANRLRRWKRGADDER